MKKRTLTIPKPMRREHDVGANTVEYHLEKVFRKLAIDFRRHLRDKLN